VRFSWRLSATVQYEHRATAQIGSQIAMLGENIGPANPTSGSMALKVAAGEQLVFLRNLPPGKH
jgi:hypothetical protein